MTIEQRLEALGLTTNRKTFDIARFDVSKPEDRVKLRAIAKNKSAKAETREACLTVLEGWKGNFKEKTKG